MRSSLRDRLLQLRQWIQWKRALTAWHVKTRAVALTVLACVAAVAVATVLEPSWTLRFERVLAWPVIALVAILAFRLPLTGLFSGRALRSLNVGPSGISA